MIFLDNPSDAVYWALHTVQRAGDSNVWPTDTPEDSWTRNKGTNITLDQQGACRYKCRKTLLAVMPEEYAQDIISSKEKEKDIGIEKVLKLSKGLIKLKHANITKNNSTRLDDEKLKKSSKSSKIPYK